MTKRVTPVIHKPENIADGTCISPSSLTDECSPYEVVVNAYHPQVIYKKIEYLTFNNSS